MFPRDIVVVRPQPAAPTRRMEDIPAEVWVAVGLFALAVVVLWLTVRFFYVRTLARALANCHPLNRAMEPGFVWLNMIPVWNVVWEIPTVDRVATSLRREFAARGLRGRGDTFGRTVGLTYCVLGLVSYLANAATLWPLGTAGRALLASGQFVLALAILAFFIEYWMRIARYNRLLAEDDRRPRGNSDGATLRDQLIVLLIVLLAGRGVDGDDPPTDDPL